MIRKVDSRISTVIDGLKKRARVAFLFMIYRYEAGGGDNERRLYMLHARHCVLCRGFLWCAVFFIDDLLIGIAINKELMTPYGQHGVYNAVFCGLKTVRDYRDRRKVNARPYTG